MIKWIKKQKYKLFVAMLTLISAVAIGIGITSNYNKSYAYSSDRLSYSIESVSNYSNVIRNTITIDNKTGYYYSISDYNNYFNFGLDLNTETSNNINFLDCYILMNYYIYDGSSIQNYDNSNSSITIRYFTDNQGGNDYISLPNTRNNYALYNVNNDNMFTYIAKISIGRNVYNKKLYLTFGNFNYGFLITNIDIVMPYDIGLSQYYDTYYGAIEDNYNQLQSEYNDLQDDYDTLNNNYTTLQSNYDNLVNEKNELQQEITDLNEYYSTLQTNYNTLQTNYNNLNLNYTTLQSNYDNLLSNYNELQTNYNTMLSNYNQISASYEALQNLNVPFNPAFINAYTITLNDNILSDIPLNSFIDYNYNSIIINYNDINLQDNQYSNDSNNIITITIKYKDSAYIDNLKGYVYSRHSYNDYTDISFIYNNNVVYQNSNMNDEHTDNNGDIAQYELLIGQTFDTLVISYRCDDLALYDNQTSKLYTFGTYYEGYQEGIEANNVYYTNLVNQYTTTINKLTSSNNDLNAVNKQLKSNISYYENQINDYIEQIENLNITSNSSYNSGYQAGLNEGASSNLETNGFKTLLNAILSYPINMIKTIFNFEFMGVNIAGLITFIISLGIVIFIIKKFVNK